MRLWKAAAKGIGLVALAAVLACPARASDILKITYVYFRTPTEIPGGKILPVGTYAFRMMDDSSSTKVVQVFLALQDGTVGTPSNYNVNKPMTPVATVLAVTDYLHRPGRAAVTYWRTHGGPNALRTLFFGTDPTALVFVYPQTRAEELAKAANQPVPFIASDSYTDPAALKNIPVKAATAGGQEVEIAEVLGKPGGHLPPPKAGGGCTYEAGNISCDYGVNDAR
jgi:hypothetical protein